MASPNPNIAVSLVEVDAAGSQVSVTFSHSRGVKNSRFMLYVNVTYLRSDLGVGNFGTTPDGQTEFVVADVRPTSMVGVYHKD